MGYCLNVKEQKDLSIIHNIKRGNDYEKQALNYIKNVAIIFYSKM